jgi:hypothetical protein
MKKNQKQGDAMTPKHDTIHKNDDQWLTKLDTVQALQPSEPGIAPARHAEEQTTTVAAVTTRASRPNRFPPMAAPSRAHQTINTKMPSLGLLDRFMQDQTIGDILVNGIESIYIDKHGKLVICASTVCITTRVGVCLIAGFFRALHRCIPVTQQPRVAEA